MKLVRHFAQRYLYVVKLRRKNIFYELESKRGRERERGSGSISECGSADKTTKVFIADAKITDLKVCHRESSLDQVVVEAQLSTKLPNDQKVVVSYTDAPSSSV